MSPCNIQANAAKPCGPLPSSYGQSVGHPCRAPRQKNWRAADPRNVGARRRSGMKATPGLVRLCHNSQPRPRRAARIPVTVHADKILLKHPRHPKEFVGLEAKVIEMCLDDGR